MNKHMVSVVGGWIGALGLIVTTTGCSWSVAPHKNLLENTKVLLSNARRADAGAASDYQPTLPGNAALFCLERALKNYQQADAHSKADRGLLVSSAVFGAGGVTMQALGAALPTPSKDPDQSAKKGFEVAGVAAIALAAGLLTIRTAAGQSEIALAERTAAAQQVDAALALLAKYALADDFKEVADDGFGKCRDSDIAVANAYPGAAAGDALRKAIVEAQAGKEEAKKQADEAKATVDNKKLEVMAKKVVAQKAAVDLQQARNKVVRGATQEASQDVAKAEQAKKEADAALAKAEEGVKTAEAQQQCKDAEIVMAEKKAAYVKAVSALRRAVFFGTTRDVTVANEEIDQAKNERNAVRQMRDKVCGLSAPDAPKGAAQAPTP